jgi:hypothetical protein
LLSCEIATALQAQRRIAMVKQLAYSPSAKHTLRFVAVKPATRHKYLQANRAVRRARHIKQRGAGPSDRRARGLEV